MSKLKLMLKLSLILILDAPIEAQKFKAEEYAKMQWMATRFYGGQRSGVGPNWLVMDHGAGQDFVSDADGDYNLSGGWHDCGDHVKYGQTQFYSGYMLLKAYAEFTRGFGDYYSPDYRGYAQAKDFSWEGRKGIPNGIPDILDEVKYATDYFIKCARDASTFYYQVGNGTLDHKRWVTSVEMAKLTSSEGGQARQVFKNPEDASMASFCGASLALMSRFYRKFDAAYADKCLRHARFAHAYAKAHPGTQGTKDGGFYPANQKWQDDYAILASELYWASGEDAFLQEAKSMSGNVSDHYYSLCYNNGDDLAAFNLARLGQSGKDALLEEMVKRYKGNVTAHGVGKTGDSWGVLRFGLAQAFSSGLAVRLKGQDAVDKFVFDNVDYAMGGNPAGQSFIVGFGAKSPRHPHHRNVYLNDANPQDKNALVIPERNSQAGILMGGTLNPGDYKDDAESYTHTEGCIDYNAGLVGALGHILSVLAPVDTSLFQGGSSALGRIARLGIRNTLHVFPLSGAIDVLGRRMAPPNPDSRAMPQ